jgi:formamidopyrimidine-DNA glycosylase
MPERPDLEYVIPRLHTALAGCRITAVHPGDPVVQRLLFPGGLDVLIGRTVDRVTRRSNVVNVHLDTDVDLVLAPMLAGRFALKEPRHKRTKDTVLALDFDNNTSLWFRDKVRMGRVVTLPKGHWEKTPGLPEVGIDVLSNAFTVDALRALTQKRREQVKLFLMDKAAFDSFGNAYADETLYAAGIHPKTRVNELADPDLVRLHAAIIRVLTHARDHIEAASPPLDKKLRDFLAVRNRKGEACPACETPIRTAGVRGHDAFFCPQCQPDKKGRGFVDWRNTRG